MSERVRLRGTRKLDLDAPILACGHRGDELAVIGGWVVWIRLLRARQRANA